MKLLVRIADTFRINSRDLRGGAISESELPTRENLQKSAFPAL